MHNVTPLRTRAQINRDDEIAVVGDAIYQSIMRLARRRPTPPTTHELAHTLRLFSDIAGREADALLAEPDSAEWPEKTSYER